jgi:hypothetical protein
MRPVGVLENSFVLGCLENVHRLGGCSPQIIKQGLLTPNAILRRM